MKKLLLVLLLILPCAVFAREYAHDQWSKDIAAFQAEDRAQMPAPGAVLFVGSSSIRFWTSIAEDFPGIRTINRGFGGSALSDATFFADRIVTPYRPRAIVLYAGDNDLQNGQTPQQVRDDFVAFVTRVRHDLPGVPIAFIAIKPSVARKVLLPQIREANEYIRTWAATQKKVAYLDVFTPMLDPQGQPRPELFVQDGLHMDRAGYDIWVAQVTAWLQAPQ
ncbi:SGNH/GDSL hydrolase family protein [Dyella tabacisoli]|uniref:SGNH hydrolase-type esterase domain-containing protein n=1 Tax=Dyella tabacisoli TaxID=2282381 RepID=A0A369ULP8_9GAMM|nr:SGNH/GDSL hydrolase family protein [Dyella tabacisoli]RDD81682.1 hypothetical protein DVJ77_10975 [Dyella tabacisoli]